MAPAEPNAKTFEQQGDAPFFAEELPGWGGYVEWEKVRIPTSDEYSLS